MNLDNKTTANLILLVMAGTWSALSIMHGVMVAVSDNFMFLAMLLGAGLVSDSAIDRLKTWRGVGK